MYNFSKKNLGQILIAPICSLLTFYIIFDAWNLDLTLPAFSYNNDALFYFFVVKNIIDTGWFVSNDAIGFPHIDGIFNSYDFPLQSDIFHILIIKFFTYFSSNVFLVTNCFFITTFALISTSSFIALRQFNVSVFVAVLISILYAFLPYHFERNVWHLFLSNYMVIPLALMSGLWICDGKVEILKTNPKGQYQFSFNKYSLTALFISLFIAINNVYYAYYSCAIFIFSWLIYSLKKGSFFNKSGFSTIVLCLITLISLIWLYSPTLFYNISHGFNTEVAGREVKDSEYFGLRIIDLLLPIENHYIKYLANLRANFDLAVGSEGERKSTTLGILASSSFLFLILWIIGKGFSCKNSIIDKTIHQFSLNKKEINLISNLSSLNLLSVLFAITGGLVMLVSINIPSLRSHARFCVFISFIALFLAAIFLDKLLQKKLFKQKYLSHFVVFIIFILAIFDQVGVASSKTAQSANMIKNYENDRRFVNEIENSMPKDSSIFVLPAFGFPEQAGDDYSSLKNYIYSNNLGWSYPAINGRASSNWQKEIAILNPKDFIHEIKKAGFNGVFIDRTQYCEKYGWSELRLLESTLRNISKKPMIFSSNLMLVFYAI